MAVGLPPSRDNAARASAGPGGAGEICPTFRFPLQQAELTVGAEAHTDEVIAAQRHFATVLVAQPANRNREAEMLLDEFTGKYLAKLSGSRSSSPWQSLCQQCCRPREVPQSCDVFGHSPHIVIVESAQDRAGARRWRLCRSVSRCT